MNFDLDRMKEAIECPVSDITLEDLARMIDEGRTWKFAELIVKKCVNFIENDMDDCFSAEMVLGHFGVKE